MTVRLNNTRATVNSEVGCGDIDGNVRIKTIVARRELISIVEKNANSSKFES